MGEQQRVQQAGNNGKARKNFIEAARKLIKESDEGRASSSCMIELKAALQAMDKRLPGGRP